MKKVEVSELQGPLTELMDQIGGQKGRARLAEFKLWLKGVTYIHGLIDLSVPCELPFDGATCASPMGIGFLKLERCGDDLCLNKKKINLLLSEEQMGGSKIRGHSLRMELLEKGGNVSASVLDACVKDPTLWPEEWKRDGGGRTLYVFFWGDIFSDSDGNLCVRFGFWDDGRVIPDYNWLENSWLGYHPAASILS